MEQSTACYEFRLCALQVADDPHAGGAGQQAWGTVGGPKYGPQQAQPLHHCHF